MTNKGFPKIELPKISALVISALRTPLMIYFVVLGNLTMITGAVLFYHFESGANPHVQSYLDAVWWSVSTVTTVGFGDIVPITKAGRVVGIGMMLVGVMFFVSSSALLVSLIHGKWIEDLMQAERVQEAEAEKMDEKLDRLSRDISQIKALLEKNSQKI